MSGWYRNRIEGHGGRVRGRGRSTPTKIHTKKSLENYLFYVESINQASDYEIMSEFVFNHIKKTFVYGNDVSEAFQKRVKADTYFWKPTIKVSYDTDVNIEESKDKQFVME